MSWRINGRFVQVDTIDHPMLLFDWYLQRGKGTWYVWRRDHNGKKLYLHRAIMRARKGERVDHINGDGLDNRRTNLRKCTNAQNMYNMRRGRGRSTYKGVAWFTRDSCWRAYICKNGKQIHLGYHNTEREAAIAYNVAARALFGEFTRPNVITG